MIDFHACLTALAQQRPLFHSEADFQHALAWHLHRREPAARVRLEYRPFPAEAIYLDLWIEMPAQTLALELKYPTRGLTVTVAGETYALKDQAAQDLTRYDFVKDIARLERVVQAYPAVTAVAILLTNDSAYWQPARAATPVDAAFRLVEGMILHGTRTWAAHVGVGTKARREAPHILRGHYPLHWAEYSVPMPSARYGVFCYLAVPIAFPDLAPV